jgi:hypothetical protein
MTYPVGSFIDLTYLNKKPAAHAQKKTYFSQAFEQSSTEVPVGTSYRFDQNLKAAKRIQVIFA